MSAEHPSGEIGGSFDPEDWLFARMGALLDECDSAEARYHIRQGVQLELADREGASYLRAKDGTPAGDFGGAE